MSVPSKFVKYSHTKPLVQWKSGGKFQTKIVEEKRNGKVTFSIWTVTAVLRCHSYFRRVSKASCLCSTEVQFFSLEKWTVCHMTVIWHFINVGFSKYQNARKSFLKKTSWISLSRQMTCEKCHQTTTFSEHDIRWQWISTKVNDKAFHLLNK